jgi:hypothetical protein
MKGGPSAFVRCVKILEEGGQSHDQYENKTTGLGIGFDWDHRNDGVFAGYGKRLCSAVGSCSEGQSSEDAGSVAEH